MPFYEYQCQACGQHHEAMQKMSAAPLKTCPHCGKPKLKRLMSAPAFRLKGSGWYETDFKSDKENRRNLHADEAKADKGDKPEAADKKPEAVPAQAEAKPEVKAEVKAEVKTEPKAEPKAEPKGESKAASRSAAKSSKKARSRASKPRRKSARRR